MSYIYIRKIDEMIEADDDQEGALTCGVEMEFLVASVHAMMPDPDPDIRDQRLLRSTSHYLENYQSQVRKILLKSLQSQLHGMPFRAWEDDVFYWPHDNVVEYTAWRLGPEHTVYKKSDAGLDERPYQWTHCELASPVMKSDHYVEQLEKVCQVLKTFRIHLNSTTAVHVHVGRGDEPFSLLTVKKFATLYWLTEKAILELQHPCRRFNKHCFRLTVCSVLASRCMEVANSKNRTSRHRDAYETMEQYVPSHSLTCLQHIQIRCIWACHSMEEVAELMQGADGLNAHDRGSVGFRRFLPAGKTGGNTQTFEWRQMSGSLDAQHISQWVKTCLAFTDFCRLSSKADFKKMVTEVIDRRGDYTGIELLEALGVDSQTFKNQAYGNTTEGRSWSVSFYDGNRGRELFVPK
ncbi:hypothetical protein F5Y10DRAFT_268987 [Nemania abortiva]|nr:hypothetical protein F5Y10DRAFT_268987 [Nemania abortiva]